jgi:hypothetical protein
MQSDRGPEARHDLSAPGAFTMRALGIAEFMPIMDKAQRRQLGIRQPGLGQHLVMRETRAHCSRERRR